MSSVLFSSPFSDRILLKLKIFRKLHLSVLFTLNFIFFNALKLGTWTVRHGSGWIQNLAVGIVFFLGTSMRKSYLCDVTKRQKSTIILCQ